MKLEEIRSKIKTKVGEAVLHKGRNWNIKRLGIDAGKEFAVSGDTEVLNNIETMSKQDMTIEKINGETHYPVREAALKTLSELKAKGIYKQKGLKSGTTQAIDIQ